MSRRKKIAAIIMATLITGTGLVGCGSSKEDSGKETLTVWSHLKTNEVKKVETLAKEWGDKNNIEVKVVEDQSKIQEFKEAANSKSGPDIMYGIPHDNLGTFQKADLLADVPNDVFKADDYVSQGVIDSVTIDGKQCALPLAQEVLALYYNKDKVKEVPKTLEDVVKEGKEKGFMFNLTDFYVNYGLLSANGGYIFKNNNGKADVEDNGLGNEGTVKGLEFIKSLVDDKLMTADVTDDIAKEKFVKGETAFYISGPWNVADAKNAGIKLGVAPIPTLNGKTVKPFLGVQTAFVSKNSKKQEKAWELIKYLNENNTDIIIKEGNRIPVLKKALEDSAFKENEEIQQFAQAAKVAEAMPNVPEVQAIWDPGKNNLKLLIAGQIDAKTAAKNMHDQVVEGIKQAK